MLEMALFSGYKESDPTRKLIKIAAIMIVESVLSVSSRLIYLLTMFNGYSHSACSLRTTHFVSGQARQSAAAATAQFFISWLIGIDTVLFKAHVSYPTYFVCSNELCCTRCLKCC